MRNVALSVIVIIAFFSKQCESYRALGLFPVPIKSHFILHEKLLKELAHRGHEVHVVSHFPQETPIPRYIDITIEGSTPHLANTVSIEDAVNKGMWDVATDLYKNLGRDLCERVMKYPSIDKLRNTTTSFDVILMEVHGTDCLLGFVHLFKVPVVGIAIGGHLPWVLERMGNPDNPSYIPNHFIPRSGKMELFYKLELALATVFTKMGYHALSTIPSEMRARDLFGTDMTPLDELAFNTSLMLVNAHFSLNEPRPTVPGIIEIGGLHIGPIKPLPMNLQKIVSSKHGFIYFSMGSVIKSETFSEEKLEGLFRALGKLPQVVLWKGEKKALPQTLPSNIYVESWFPQQDLLCNSNIKAFVTHGGLMSIQEAAHCGVPILGIPIFPDQSLIVHNYVKKGAALRVDYTDITEEAMTEALHTVINNATYRAAAKRLSSVYRDRPVKPLENAVYWIEYVVRHGGARHLRTVGADLIWFEYYLLDVAIVVAALFLLALFLMTIVLDRLQNYFDNPYQPPAPATKKLKEK